MQTIAMFFLASVAVGGVAWVFVYPILSGERKAEQRMANVAKGEPAARAPRGHQKSRRDIIETTLKKFDERHKKSKRVPLSVRIAQAGLFWSKRQFFLLSAGIGVVMLLLGLFTGGGIKAGLPLLDCLKMITIDAPEPVKSEFRAIVETQAIGMLLGDACGKLYEQMPVPEANFFGIVIAIQQRSGGNLAEALGNLSRVLRDRKKMKAKIQAMSMEAKASASIIGALPVAVMTMVWITSPQYISLLWTEPLGRMMLAASVLWMSMGVMVMKKMINFDF